jgi:hypothetical protein
MIKVLLLIILLILSTLECSKMKQNVPCTDIRYSDGILTAHCKAVDGRINSASLILDTCVGNDDGILIRGENFSGSCMSCFVHGQTLDCFCKKIDRTYFHTSLDLSSFITNQYGNLACN